MKTIAVFVMAMTCMFSAGCEDLSSPMPDAGLVIEPGSDARRPVPPTLDAQTPPPREDVAGGAQ